MIISRRAFVKNVAAIASVASLNSQDSSRNEWGGSIVDCHHHLRRTPEANLVHLDGAGISNAVVLARENSADQIGALKTQYPGRFLGWFASTDITNPEAADLLTKAVKSGAIGFGELKSHVAAAGPDIGAGEPPEKPARILRF